MYGKYQNKNTHNVQFLIRIDILTNQFHELIHFVNWNHKSLSAYLKIYYRHSDICELNTGTLYLSDRNTVKRLAT